MGNLWNKCCGSEEEIPLQYAAAPSPKRDQPLITSALRVPGSLPSLHSRRKDNRRMVRIEANSPIIVEADEYETASDASDRERMLAGYDNESIHPVSEVRATSPPSIPKVASNSMLSKSMTPPPPSSGLRLLLTASNDQAVSSTALYESETERKEDEDSGQRGLRRVERHDSLHTVLRKDENDVMFAKAPVAAMKNSDLPSGLIFAFLDDCAVSRTSFGFTLKNTFKGAETSIIRGRSLEEAEAFVDDVLRLKPDIVVLDQCLDYELANGEPKSLRGTDVAREIRLKGFDGCIIVQSEQDSLKQEVDFTIVDGITGKQNASAAFAMAWMIASARRRGKLNPSTGLSSTMSSYNSRGEPSFSFDVEERDLINLTDARLTPVL